MTLRLFYCPACDHKLRYGAITCGKCHAPTATRNHRWVAWAGLALIVALVALLVLLSAG